jgi:hypothetical protein
MSQQNSSVRLDGSARSQFGNLRRCFQKRKDASPLTSILEIFSDALAARTGYQTLCSKVTFASSAYTGCGSMALAYRLVRPTIGLVSFQRSAPQKLRDHRKSGRPRRIIRTSQPRWRAHSPQFSQSGAIAAVRGSVQSPWGPLSSIAKRD